jgi:sigma-B regulation protein RsbU (phosphoserine phosphatase)
MSRVLIVEDDPAILCGLKDNLEFESHHVLTAADGEAGYRMLSEHSPDLVILDLMLPKLSGYDLCRRARNEGFHAPILMLSARSQEADRVMGLDLGANDYVSKPFSLRELLARVRALLRHEREHRQDEERLNRELEMAAKVQQDLFPHAFPKVPGLDYAGICCPARGVSGDYYDFVPLGEGKLAFLLADVSGKGISAALLGASLHAAVWTNVRSGEADCGKVLAKANRLLFETTAPERFATVFYAVYDATTRKLTYANAGHCPPMLVRQDTSIRLESLTPPLGMLPGLKEVEREVQLVPGDWLLVFSDGVTEAADTKGLEFGEEALLRAFHRAGMTGAEGTCEFVIEEVRNHLQELCQPDDITLIAMKVMD